MSEQRLEDDSLKALAATVLDVATHHRHPRRIGVVDAADDVVGEEDQERLLGQSGVVGYLEILEVAGSLDRRQVPAPGTGDADPLGSS